MTPEEADQTLFRATERVNWYTQLSVKLRERNRPILAKEVKINAEKLNKQVEKVVKSQTTTTNGTFHSS